MQAIARANRVHDGKNNGLIVDYGGILKSLQKALATFAGESGEGTGGGEIDPVRPEEELLDDLRETIAFVRAFLTERKATLDVVINSAGRWLAAPPVEMKSLVRDIVEQITVAANRIDIWLNRAKIAAALEAS